MDLLALLVCNSGCMVAGFAEYQQGFIPEHFLLSSTSFRRTIREPYSSVVRERMGSL
jgi:hypothetical protein